MTKVFRTGAPKPHIAVIGGGPAGLIAAEILAGDGHAVTVYDRMPTAGRKFLLAGRGGLNLIHSEGLDRFLTRYGDAEPHLRSMIEAFPPSALQAWCEDLGQPVFTGSSGRIFPAAMKASPLLRAWLARLRDLEVLFRLRHQWTGWNAEGALTFSAPDGPATVKPDATIFALGGASWPHLGSDGSWAALFPQRGVPVTSLQPANCGFRVDWSEHFREKFAGQPLKDITVRCGDSQARGELLLTRAGVEGGVIYALGPAIRAALASAGETIIHIDLRPAVSAGQIEARLAMRRKESLSNTLRKHLSLPVAAVALLHEAVLASHAPLSDMNASGLAALIKSVPVRITDTAAIARAISTAGGIAFSGVDRRLMLRALPGTFVAGEMLDWEAPTGGYLLQACFATGVAAARGALDWMREKGCAAGEIHQ